MFGALTADVKGYQQLSYGGCLQRDLVVLPSTLAYPPLCPGGASARQTYGGGLGSDRDVRLFEGWTVSGRGNWGYGMQLVKVGGDVINPAAMFLLMPLTAPTG